MQQLLNRRSLSILLLAFIVSSVVNGGLRLLNVWLSPTESVLRTVIFATTFLQQGVFILLIIQSIAQTSTQSSRQLTALPIIACGVYIFAGFLSIRLANVTIPSIKLRGYEAFIDENRFLVEAIERYTVEHGHPPDRLDQLYPDYLSPPQATFQTADTVSADEAGRQLLIPYKSIDAKSTEQLSYAYEFPDQTDEGDPDRWELSITIQLGSFSWVKFVYNEAQVYEADYAQIGEWGYRERQNR